MKILLPSLLTFAALSSAAVAEEFVVTQDVREEVIEVEVERPRPTIEGIVTEIFTTRPWQAVNPLAPKSYGSGEKLVSKDFGPGTPYHSTTVTVVGVEW